MSTPEDQVKLAQEEIKTEAETAMGSRDPSSGTPIQETKHNVTSTTATAPLPPPAEANEDASSAMDAENVEGREEDGRREQEDEQDEQMQGNQGPEVQEELVSGITEGKKRVKVSLHC